MTGSSQGIGAAIARKLASEGAEVVIAHRAGDPHIDRVAREIRRSGGTATAMHADVSDPESVSRLFREVWSELGGLDVLVNAAGLSDRRIWNVPLSRITLDMWRRVFAVDAFGTFLCTQAAAKIMKKGAVVNIASTPALAGDSEGLVYASAKGAVISMTRMLARTLAPKVRVNCMALGSIETIWVEWLAKAQLESYRAAIPLGRFGSPEEVAKVALFLASDDSSFITGQVLVVDGGEVSR